MHKLFVLSILIIAAFQMESGQGYLITDVLVIGLHFTSSLVLFNLLYSVYMLSLRGLFLYVFFVSIDV